MDNNELDEFKAMVSYIKRDSYYDSVPLGALEDTRSYLNSINIRWAKIVEDEIEHIFNYGRRNYFLWESEYADEYRNHRGIYLKDEFVHGKNRFVHGKETLNFRDIWDRRKKQRDHFGVTLWHFSAGFACFAERQEFYRSDEWQRRARVVRYTLCAYNK